MRAQTWLAANRLLHTASLRPVQHANQTYLHGLLIRSAVAWAVSEHTDTSNNTKAWVVSQHTDTSNNTKAWAVSQHTDTSNNTRAWAVSQHTDTSNNTKAWVVPQHTDTSNNTKAWAVPQHTDTSNNTKSWAVPQHTVMGNNHVGTFFSRNKLFAQQPPSSRKGDKSAKDNALMMWRDKQKVTHNCFTLSNVFVLCGHLHMNTCDPQSARWGTLQPTFLKK